MSDSEKNVLDLRKTVKKILEDHELEIEQLKASIEEHTQDALKARAAMEEAEKKQDAVAFKAALRERGDQDITLDFYFDRLEEICNNPYLPKDKLVAIVSPHIKAYEEKSNIRREKILKRVQEIVALSAEDRAEREAINEAAAELDWKAAKSATYYSGSSEKLLGKNDCIPRNEVSLYGPWLFDNEATKELKKEHEAKKNNGQ